MLNYNCETKDIGYCYDKIRLNFNIPVNELTKLLPKNDLINESSHFLVSKSSDDAQKYGLISKIEMVAPSRKCLEIIDKYIPPLITIKISKLEIAQDIFFETEREALFTLYKLLRTIRKKYTSKHRIYDQFYVEEKKKKSKINKKLFSPVTGYFGSGKFEYVIYARLSKINNRPCIHTEWRIIRASTLKRKTGIVSIHDLITFDLLKFFDKQNNRFIVHESIDLTKLGRWLLGWNKRKSFSNRELMKMGITGRIFCNVHKIKTYADLVNYFMVVKKILQGKRGPKTSYQEKFLSLTNYGVWRKPYYL